MYRSCARLRSVTLPTGAGLAASRISNTSEALNEDSVTPTADPAVLHSR